DVETHRLGVDPLNDLVDDVVDGGEEHLIARRRGARGGRAEKEECRECGEPGAVLAAPGPTIGSHEPRLLGVGSPSHLLCPALPVEAITCHPSLCGHRVGFMVSARSSSRCSPTRAPCFGTS